MVKKTLHVQAQEAQEAEAAEAELPVELQRTLARLARDERPGWSPVLRSKPSIT